LAGDYCFRSITLVGGSTADVRFDPRMQLRRAGYTAAGELVVVDSINVWVRSFCGWYYE